MFSALLLLLPVRALAQNVVFDGTLGTPGVPEIRTLPSGIQQYLIRQERGQTDRTGRNLFHSFSQFSLSPNQEAAFRSSAGIQNILVRVTGNSASELNGRLQTNQLAPVNLFLINPKGVVFGPNARIDGITGSFVATTLDAIAFPNGQFSAVQTGDRTSLLTLVGDPSGFLASQRQPGTIQINRQNREVSRTDLGIEGLFVRPGRSLIFLGGNVTLQDSNLEIDRAGQLGRSIELGGIASAGFVRLAQTGTTFSLVFPDNVPKADIAIVRSQIRLAAQTGGQVILNARQVNIRDSNIFLGNGTGGRIAVNAQDLTAANSELILAVQGGTNLVSAQGGTVQLEVADTLALSRSVISSEVREGGTAQGGDVDIATRRLIAQNSQIRADTFGTGNAGNLTVHAADAVILSGDYSRGTEQGPGGLFAQVNSTLTTTGIGNGGNLTVVTPLLQVQDGSKVQAATFGRGNAGNVLIQARTVEVTDSAIPNLFPTAINAGATLTLIPEIDARGDLRGNGGNLTIATDQLTVRGGEITVENFGVGAAGNLFITVGDRVDLSDRSQLTAASRSGQGGNITLNVHSILLLQNHSQISTSAGTLQFPGTGGNILINAPFVISPPLQNNDITANAFGGSGGTITINAQRVLGLTPRSQQELQQLLRSDRLDELDPAKLPTNDITAISRTSPTLNGVVTINTLDLDPSQGLVSLPSNFVDSSRQIAQACSPTGKQAASSFVATGRGGLPPSPTDPLGNDAVVAEWVMVADGEGGGGDGEDRGDGGGGGDRKDGETGRRGDAGSSQFSIMSFELQDPTQNSLAQRHEALLRTQNSPSPSPIVEAQGWLNDAEGNLYLVAAPALYSGNINVYQNCFQR